MDTWEYLKTQLSPKDWKILQELHSKFNLNFDSKTLAEIWTDFVDFEKKGGKQKYLSC